MNIRWIYKGRRYVSEVVAQCPMCGERAVVKLPAAIRREQPDDTTHVCHPLAGGCNHGFALGVKVTEVLVQDDTVEDRR
jgi:rRNA maturation protein Nop10